MTPAAIIITAVMGPRPVTPYLGGAPYQPDGHVLALCERWAMTRAAQRAWDRRVAELSAAIRAETRCIEDRAVEQRRAA